LEKEKILDWLDGEEMRCDEKEHKDHDKNWIAKNITELMSHLLQGYDRRIRPFFESKTSYDLNKRVHITET
jgi:hypothetical protein